MEIGEWGMNGKGGGYGVRESGHDRYGGCEAVGLMEDRMDER